MKILFSFILSLIWIHTSYAQSTEEIIQKHIEVIGGEKWNSISTFFIAANTTSKEGSISIAKTVVRGKSVRNDITVEPLDAARSEKKYYIILDGDKGWKYLPGDPTNTIYTLYTNEVGELWDELDYEDPFIRYIEKDREINLLGIVFDEKEELYKFSVRYKSGRERLFYLNTKTLLIEQSETTGIDGRVRYQDYEMLPEGILIAKKISSNEGVLKIVKVKVNPPVDPEIFIPSDKTQFTYSH